MTKRDDAKHRARYTLEFKLEAVRLVKAGQEAPRANMTCCTYPLTIQ